MISTRNILKVFLVILTVISYVFCELTVNLYAQNTTANVTNPESWNIYFYKFEHTSGPDTETVKIIKSNGHNILSHALIDLNETCSKKFSIMIRDEEKAYIYHVVDHVVDGNERSGDLHPADNEITQPQRADYILKPSFYGKEDIITAEVEAINVHLQDVVDIPRSIFMHDKYVVGIENLACHLAEKLHKKEGRSVPECAKVRKIGFGRFENLAGKEHHGALVALDILYQSELIHLLKEDKTFEISGAKGVFDIEISGHLVSSGSALVASMKLRDNKGDFIDSINETIEIPINPGDEAKEIARRLDEALH